MSTNPNTNGRKAARRAVTQAGRGTEAWQAAVTAQRSADPEHGALYELAAEVVATLRRLDELCTVLTPQVSSYGIAVALAGDRLRDDVPGHDPSERVAIASSWAAQTAHLIGEAARAAGTFWSEIGHVGVEPGEVDR